MGLPTLRARLEQSFQPAAAGAIDASFRLAVGGESLTFHVNHGVLDFSDLPQCDATFYFDSEEAAWALLSGRANPFEAFMNGQFRADGYLVWAFALMAMFRDPGPPRAAG